MLSLFKKETSYVAMYVLAIWQKYKLTITGFKIAVSRHTVLRVLSQAFPRNHIHFMESLIYGDQ